MLVFELSSICSSLPFIFWAVDLPPTKRSTSNRIDQQALALHGAPPRLPRRSVLLSPLLPRARDAPRHSPSPDAFAFSSGDRLRSVLLPSRRALKRQNDRALGRVVAPSPAGPVPVRASVSVPVDQRQNLSGWRPPSPYLMLFSCRIYFFFSRRNLILFVFDINRQRRIRTLFRLRLR